MTAAVLALALTLAATPAFAAEWTLSAFLGASATADATLTLKRANLPDVTSADVPLAGHAFASPPYYGYRFGWRPSASARVGLDAELIHLKVYAAEASLAAPVEAFSLSHGLNLLLGNVVLRQPVTPRISFDARVGAGVAIPHAESRVAGVAQEQYEVSSAALQAAAGPRLVLSRRLAAFAEYKLTTAAPTVHVAGGTIRGRYTSQHVAAGLEVAW